MFIQFEDGWVQFELLFLEFVFSGSSNSRKKFLPLIREDDYRFIETKKDAVLIYLLFCFAEHYSCAQGWFAMSKYCYKFFSTSLSWPAAKIACQKHNSHLIKASSSTAQTVLRSKYQLVIC